MIRLRVKGFGSIESAEVEVDRMTVIIGPQASGKSLLSKLIHFFEDVLFWQFDEIEYQTPLNDFCLLLQKKFVQQFPVSAWGRDSFHINFSAGEFGVEIKRPRRLAKNAKHPEKIQISFSRYYEKYYADALDAFSENASSRKERARRRIFSRESFSIRRDLEERLKADLSESYYENLTFIPAGRSFFTTVGKAIAVFEQSQALDRVTMNFGRNYLAAREQHLYPMYFANEKDSERHESRRSRLAERFFGGRLVFEKDTEYVETPDSRRIPFSILSSGQQELLPLYLVLDFLQVFGYENSLIFIEEPEAHLWPTAQAQVVEYLSTIVGRETGNSLIVTTHSPYVLSCINNLLKAGTIGKDAQKSVRSRVERIIPQESWLDPRSVRAYALMDGVSVPLMYEDQIDADYLDSVSEDILFKFDQLLDVEIGRK